MKLKTKKSIREVAIAISAVLVICIGWLFTTLVVNAYFSTKVYLYTADNSAKEFRMGMELNTFFDIINADASTDDPAVATGTSLGILCNDTSVVTTANKLTVTTPENTGDPVYYTYNPNASWGSASNPYIISRVNHFQNLYALQNCGFFDELYTSGGTTEDKMPYFLVCTSTGHPVVIDGTDKTILSIGSEDFPFIGYIGGAFNGGTILVGDDEKSCDQSILANLNVVTDNDQIDIGLFGHVGYLGDDSTADSNKQFNGTASTIRNLLLYDVSVTVKYQTIWDSITTFLANHLFSYGKGSTISENANQPCEDHHIGILAGHVDYATIEYISVYYSSDNVAAIDVDHKSTTAANYYSVSGIMGFVNEMNSVSADGKITIGGISNIDMEVNQTGDGTGGGIQSGFGRGYVTANDVYKYYHDAGNIVKVTTDRVKYGVLVNLSNTPVTYIDEDGDEAQTILTLTDGTPVKATTDLSAVETFNVYKNFFNQTEVSVESWYSYVIHDLTAIGTDHEYWYPSGGVSDPIIYASASQVEDAGISLKYAARLVEESGNTSLNYLCIQYVRDRVGSTLTNWTQSTGRYYFYDGVFTFSLSEVDDSVEFTWKDGTVDKLVVGANEDSAWTQDESALPNSIIAFLKPITTEDQLRSGREVFIAYYDESTSQYHIVTLDGNSSYHSGQGDNSVRTEYTDISLITQETKNMIYQSIIDGTFTVEDDSYATVSELSKAFSYDTDHNAQTTNLQILDLGTTEGTGLTLEELKNQYQVKVYSHAQDIAAGTYEDDDTTSATAALMSNSQNINQYYTIDSVSDVQTDNINNITYFTLNNSPKTANPTSVYNAITNFNSLYFSLDSVNTVSGYYSLKTSGTTQVTIANAKTAIDSLNSLYFPESSVSTQNTNGTQYYKKVANTTANLTNIGTNMTNLNGKYYTCDSVTYNGSYFSLNSGAKEYSLATLQSAIDYYNSTYYLDDESTVLTSTTLKNAIANNTPITKDETHYYDGFIAFETNPSSYRAWYGYGCSLNLYYVNSSGSGLDTTLKTTDKVYSMASRYQEPWEVSNGVTFVETDKYGINIYKFTVGSKTYQGPLLYYEGSTLYEKWENDHSSKVITYSGSGFTLSNNKYYKAYTATYHYIVASYTGSGTTYTFDGTSTACTYNGSTSKHVTDINGYTFDGNNYNLHSCTRTSDSAKFTECVLVYRYYIDGIMRATCSGSGISNTLIKWENNAAVAISGKTLNSTYSKVKSFKYNSVTYDVYKNNNYLGIRVQNYYLDGIILQNSTGTGFKYDLINTSGTDIGDASSSMTDIGTAFSFDSATYRIYKSNGHLGFKVCKITLDGIITQTSTGNGFKYDILNTSGADIGDTNSTRIDTGTDITINSKSYDVYISNGKMGICLARFSLDGIMLQQMTGSGVTYSLVNGSATVISGKTINNTFTNTNTQITIDGNVYNVYKSNTCLGLRLAKYKIDGYVMANVTTSGTNYVLNSTYALHETPKDTAVSYPISNGTTTKRYTLYIADGYLMIKLIHYDAGQQYYYNFYHLSNNPSDPYYLRILRRAYSLSTQYGIICSDNANLSDPTKFNWGIYACQSVSSDIECTVTVNGDGTAYLQYTINGNTRYLNYSSSGYFNTSTSKSTTSKLYLFTLEATHTVSLGNHIIPVAGTESTTYSADKYVLWPNSVYDSNDTSTSEYSPSNTYITDSTYSIKSLSDLYSLGWKDSNGKYLGSDDLDMVFSLGSGISDVNMTELWGGNTGTLLTKNNYVKAPIGTDGEEAYIPTGCLAFKVKNTKTTNKIRVIVAVPLSEYFYGQKSSTSTYLNPASLTGLDYSTDYNFCMWKIPATSTSTSFQFSSSNAYQSFELPRSTPYDPETEGQNYYTAIANNDYSVTGTDNVCKYINITIGGTTKRAYLNGEQVLIAYEFTANEEGTYLLGSTKECRIVFFSADATASEGKDGVTSYRMGSIDFVYDNSLTSPTDVKIITTLDGDPESDGVFDYNQYYYPSLVMLFTNNSHSVVDILEGDTDVSTRTYNSLSYSYANINDFVVYIRRKQVEVDGVESNTYKSDFNVGVKGGTEVTGGITDAAYIVLASYSLDADYINRRDDELRPTT